MKTQTITFLILFAVSALLLIEFISRRTTNPEPQVEEEGEELAETTPTDSTGTSSSLSVADSIRSLYSSYAYKEKQLKFPRVQKAYDRRYDTVLKKYELVKVDPKKVRLYLRAFKRERILEVWAKNDGQQKFRFLTSYPFCETSGTLGPKRKEGDLQIPEGFYRINNLNPQSKFHLSLGINYPNRSDVVLGDTTNIGGDIFIHGGCVTVGCIPITNEKIEELYTIIVDARAADQERIPITIFPAKMNDENFASLKTEHESNHPEWISLWNNLKDAYKFFEDCQQLPTITFLPDGKHNLSSGCN